MPKIVYQEIAFKPSSLALVHKCNEVIAEYTAQGFVLTLRQLYYQMVSRDIIPNRVTEYKRLGSIVNDARLAGLIDWNAIEDRTRNLRDLAHWTEPSDIIESCAAQFRIDRWAGQSHRVEVWIEKDALVGVIEGVCREWDVPFFSCRGYTSQSEMWGAAQRLRAHLRAGQTPVILHLGDHDPSGIDMTRDISDRLTLFAGQRIEIKRLALNMAQVEQYDPPPNPAKTTDSRYASYANIHGDESWELDALEPRVIADLIRTNITQLLDLPEWREAKDVQDGHREMLGKVAQRWDDITSRIEDEDA